MELSSAVAVQASNRHGTWDPITSAQEDLDTLRETNPDGHERHVKFVRRSLEGTATSKWVIVRCLGRMQPVQHWAVLVESRDPVESGYVWEVLQEKNNIYLSVGRWARKEDERINEKKVDKIRVTKTGITRLTDM